MTDFQVVLSARVRMLCGPVRRLGHLNQGERNGSTDKDCNEAQGSAGALTQQHEHRGRHEGNQGQAGEETGKGSTAAKGLIHGRGFQVVCVSTYLWSHPGHGSILPYSEPSQ